MTARILFGFHAVGVRLKTAPRSVLELHVDPARRDARMQHFVARAVEAGVKLVESERRPAGAARRLAPPPGRGGAGRAARAGQVARRHARPRSKGRRCVLVLDGVTDPHNLGACLRVADGAGAHAVVAPKDHAVGLNATVAKVASGAAETVPYFMVTNLARTLNELKERDIRVVGTAEDAPRSIYDARPHRPAGAGASAPKGKGMRQLTAQDLRRARAPADARRGREPQRLGRERRLPVRSGAAAPAEEDARDDDDRSAPSARPPQGRPAARREPLDQELSRDHGRDRPPARLRGDRRLPARAGDGRGLGRAGRRSSGSAARR